MEPPTTKHLPVEQVDKFAENPLVLRIPCHSQRVERCVKWVTEASGAVYRKDVRDGYIRAVFKSHHFIPNLEASKITRIRVLNETP